jgi:hypothetical protein
MTVSWYSEAQIKRAADRAAAAFEFLLQREPTPVELSVLLSQAAIEGGFGEARYRAWNEDPKAPVTYCPALYNWGAFHEMSDKAAVGDMPPCAGLDHHADGSRYLAWLARWSSPELGALGWLRQLHTKWNPNGELFAAAEKGDIPAFAAVLKKRGYYEAPEAGYVAAMRVHYPKILSVLSPAPVSSGGSSVLPLLGLASLGLLGATVATKRKG